MIDPELKGQLDQINQNLVLLQKKQGRGLWHSFFSGIMNALGYIAGLILIILILGWILQKMGLLTAFESQIQNFTDLVNQAKNITAPTSSTTSKTPTKVTLPNGQQVEINLPSGY